MEVSTRKRGGVSKLHHDLYQLLCQELYGYKKFLPKMEEIIFYYPADEKFPLVDFVFVKMEQGKKRELKSPLTRPMPSTGPPMSRPTSILR